MLDVNKRRKSATLLRLRNHRQGKCRFSGRFRTENFYYPASWKPAYAESTIDQNVAGRNDIDIDDFLVAKAHDRAFAVIFGYLLNRQIEVFVSRRRQFFSGCFFFGLCRHIREHSKYDSGDDSPSRKASASTKGKKKGREPLDSRLWRCRNGRDEAISYTME